MSGKRFAMRVVLGAMGLILALVLAGCGPGSARAFEVEFSHPDNTALQRLCVFTDQERQLWCRDTKSGTLAEPMRPYHKALPPGKYRFEFSIACTGWLPNQLDYSCSCVDRTGTGVFEVAQESVPPLVVELASWDAVYPCFYQPEPTADGGP